MLFTVTEASSVCHVQNVNLHRQCSLDILSFMIWYYLASPNRVHRWLSTASWVGTARSWRVTSALTGSPWREWTGITPAGVTPPFRRPPPRLRHRLWPVRQDNGVGKGNIGIVFSWYNLDPISEPVQLKRLHVCQVDRNHWQKQEYGCFWNKNDALYTDNIYLYPKYPKLQMSETVLQKGSRTKYSVARRSLLYYRALSFT